jgi:hypothetical protein
MAKSAQKVILFISVQEPSLCQSLSTAGTLQNSPSNTVAEPSLTCIVDAHIKTPKLMQNTTLAMPAPALTVTRQLPTCFATSKSRIDDSSDTNPVSDFSDVENIRLAIVVQKLHTSQTKMRETAEKDRNRRDAEVHGDINDAASPTSEAQCGCMHDK